VSIVSGGRQDHGRILNPPYAIIVNDLSQEDRLFVCAQKAVHAAQVLHILDRLGEYLS
jgi:hypothetical protein